MWKQTWIVLLFPFLSWPLSSLADSRSVYFDSLKVAQAKVERGNRPAGAPGALSTSLLGQFLGRPYRVGDSWRVAAWIPDPSIMRQTLEPGALSPKRGRGGIFRYAVVGTHGTDVDIEITQEGTVVDPHVGSLELTVSLASGFEQKSKKYILKDGGVFSASASGLHVPVSHLELFPLEAPLLTTAIRGEASALPALPPELQAMASGASLTLDPAHCARFEQDDFFGREVDAIWRQGDPWPVYLKTTNGIAVLISGVNAAGGGQ